MSLLAPLFLIAGLAAALPFWLHRRQVQSAERQAFSSTMLLETTERQVHVKKKLRHLVLLTLRVAALLLLAFAFAKPIWDRTSLGALTAASGTHLLLIDTSASMQREDVFARAVDAAAGALDTIPGDALIQVLSADSRLRAESDLSADKGTQRGAIEALEPSYLRLDLGTTMTAVDRFAADLPSPVTLHVISDFQDSGLPVQFADLVGASIGNLVLYPVAGTTLANWRVDYVARRGTGVDIGVTASADAEAPASLSVTLNGRAIGRQDLANVGVSTRSFGDLPLEPGDNKLTALITAGDSLAFDNSWYAVIENRPPAAIPLITANPDGRAATYLDAALRADSRDNYELTVMRIGDADFRTLTRYPWAVIDDLGDIDGNLEATLREYVENGGNLLASAGRRAINSARLPVTGHAVRPSAVGVASGRGGGFLSIGQIDTAHPALAGTEGWHAVNVTQNLAVDSLDGDQVLVRLEDGTPLMIERRLGQGRVLLLTSGLDNEWNDLPIRPVFVSFVVEAARYLSGAETVTKSFTTGDALPLALIKGVSGQVIGPSGETLLSLADTTSQQQIRLEQPGFFEVYTPRGDYVVAVNPDSRESSPGTVAADMLERWQAAISAQAARGDGGNAQLASAPLELWHAALLLLALLVIGESILGNMYLRPQSSG